MTVLNEIEDANAILKYVKKDKYVRKIFLLGHYQGGVIASILAGLYPDIVDGLILLSAASVLKEDAIKGQLMGYRYDSNHIPDQLKVFGLTVGVFYLGTAKKLPIYEIAKNYTGKVLIIDGDSDFVVLIKYAKEYDHIYQNSILKIVHNLGHDYLGNSTNLVGNLIINFLRKEN